MAQITASLVVAVVAAAGSLAGQTSLSVYSDGRVVVRRGLPQPLEKGHNTLTLQLPGAAPATLFSPDTALTFLSATPRPATDPAAAMGRALGQTPAVVRPRSSRRA